MKVLVTGGAGYIGAELVYNLSKLPEVSEIVVYDNLSRGNYNLFISSSNKIQAGNVKFIFGDLLDSRKLKKALDGVEMVYHLAAKVATPYQDVDSHFYEQVNNWGTAELMYAIEDTHSVKKLVYLSSTSVYGGSKKGEMVNEDTVPNPRKFYSISKLRGEEHVERMKDKINTIIVRVGNVYGYSPAIRFDSVINKFLFEANFNNRIQIHGSGKQARSFISVSKVIGVLSGMITKEVPSDTYNLVDKNVQLLDLVDVFKEIFPDLEFIFINQHLELRDMQVDRNTKLLKLFPFEETDIKSELIELRDKSFAFSSAPIAVV